MNLYMISSYIEYMDIKPILELEDMQKDIAIRLYYDGWTGGTISSLIETAILLTGDEVHYDGEVQRF